jgi:mannitol-specific phosphotransferase system IIBC component
MPEDDRSNKKATSAHRISKFETVHELEEEFQIKQLRNKIAKMDEKALKHKILIAISAVGSFVIVTFLFFHYLLVATKSDYNVSAVLSVIAGCFAAFLIMAISGIIKEFSIKSGFIEVTSKIEEKIETVQTNVEQSKKEVQEKISNLNQAIQSIDIKITSMNQNQLVSNPRMGDTVFNFPGKDETKLIKEKFAKGQKQIKNLEDRSEHDLGDATTEETIVRQKTLEGDA